MLHRMPIVVAVRDILPPVTSLYEMGCGAGANLRLLQTACPEIRLGGAEPLTDYRTFAVRALGIPLDPPGFPSVPAGEWDSVLSCYALAYVEPAIVFETFGRLREETTVRVVILLEPTEVKTVRVGEASGVHFHGYERILDQAGWKVGRSYLLLPVHQGLERCFIFQRA